MTSLNDNRPLMYALLSVGLFSVALASNMLPDVSSQFEIIIFPAEFRNVFNFLMQCYTSWGHGVMRYVLSVSNWSYLTEKLNR